MVGAQGVLPSGIGELFLVVSVVSSACSNPRGGSSEDGYKLRTRDGRWPPGHRLVLVD